MLFILLKLNKSDLNDYRLQIINSSIIMMIIIVIML